MSEQTKTIKLHLHIDNTHEPLLTEVCEQYALACNFVSQYVFDNCFVLSSNEVQKHLYRIIRDLFDLKSQLAVSVFKTVIARYKTVKKQLSQTPYKYKDENDKWCYTPRTLEWLRNPISFKRPQADLVRGRDYSFVENGTKLSINTLDKRIRVSFDVPHCFKEYFDGSWSFGTAKLVSLKGLWYLHIPVTKELPETFDKATPSHTVGIDRGLRFIATTYDEQGKTVFINGKDILKKRDAFAKVRAELQAKGSKSAKRKLKAISGRENRWMNDVNHQISKTLVDRYGSNTLFVIEDLAGVSFDDNNLKPGRKEQHRNLRSWSFYQLEQFLTYKAEAAGSKVIKVSAKYTSQRCPKCGRIHKENRNHDTHEYICDICGYHSNDDRIGAMNLYDLGLMWLSGNEEPQFDKTVSVG